MAQHLEPKVLDCNCTVDEEESYFDAHFKIWNSQTKTLDSIDFTYCGDEDCFKRLVAEKLDNHNYCQCNSRVYG